MDIRQDPVTGDLDLSTGTLQLVDGVDAIAQELRIRLRFFLGEWFLDTRQGVPYFQKILGQKRRKSIIDQIFKRIILDTPGVTSLDSFSQAFDGATRTLSIDFVCVTESGALLNFSDVFIVGTSG